MRRRTNAAAHTAVGEERGERARAADAAELGPDGRRRRAGVGVAVVVFGGGRRRGGGEQQAEGGGARGA